MKNSKILIVLFTFILLTAWSQKSAAQSIAYVETEKVIPEMASYKKAKSEVEAYGKQLQKGLEQKQKELQAYYTAVSDSIKNGLMTGKEQKEAEAKLQKKENANAFILSICIINVGMTGLSLFPKLNQLQHHQHSYKNLE